MLSLGLPVPPALCLPIEECRRFHANGAELEAESWGSVLAGIAGLEEKLGRTFGGGEHPLLVSVRSGAAVSMPGMMDTVLNLGITAEVEATLGRLSGDVDFARQTHNRFVHQFGETVLKADIDEPAIGPRCAGVRGLVDAVAHDVDVANRPRFSGAGPHDVRIAR